MIETTTTRIVTESREKIYVKLFINRAIVFGGFVIFATLEANGRPFWFPFRADEWDDFDVGGEACVSFASLALDEKRRSIVKLSGLRNSPKNVDEMKDKERDQRT